MLRVFLRKRKTAGLPKDRGTVARLYCFWGCPADKGTFRRKPAERKGRGGTAPYRLSALFRMPVCFYPARGGHLVRELSRGGEKHA